MCCVMLMVLKTLHRIRPGEYGREQAAPHIERASRRVQHGPAIGVVGLPGSSFPAEQLHPCPAPVLEVSPQFLVTCHLLHCPGQRPGGMAIGVEGTIAADLGDRRHGHRDDRGAARHGFERGKAESLVKCRKDHGFSMLIEDP